MSPTILRIGSYRFFFNSREERRRHIHISCPEGSAKFWLEPIVALACHYNLSTGELRRLENIVKEREDEFTSAWNKHFGS
ncbi:MAG: DUF4160 domain-containing protein [Deltaproteobacteria bacterium]|nr:DUF4160 domain-containing protein [Deltaproteobacteria bacterium]